MTTTDKTLDSTSLEIGNNFYFANNCYICDPRFESYQKICRFCLSFDNLKPLFGMTYQQKSVESIILDCLLLKVEPEDSLPSNLCAVCIAELIRCYNFRKRCIQINGTLQDANRNFRNRTISQCNISECGGKRTDVNSDDLIIKNGELQKTQSISDGIIVNATNSANVIIKNEDVDSIQPVCNYDTFKNIKNKDIGDILNICNDNSLKDANPVSLIITNEETCDTQCIPLDIVSDDINGNNVIIKNVVTNDRSTACNYEILEGIGNDVITKNENNSDELTIGNDILEGNDNHDLIIKTNKVRIKQTNYNDYIFGEINDNDFSSIKIENTTVYPEPMNEKHVSQRTILDTMFKKTTSKLILPASEAYPKNHRKNINHQKQMYHTCKICKKKFKKNDVLQHFNRKSCICRVCTETLMKGEAHVCRCRKIFGTSAELISHMKLHTKKKTCICTVCAKSFTQSSSLNVHMLIHTGKKPHNCTVCGMAFRQITNLKVHVLIHAGVKPHKCTVCERSFTQLSSLHRHSLRHARKEQHKCSICEKYFTQISCLKRHMLIHTDKKPHKCNICDNSFIRLSSLRAHILTHTGEKPHKCSACEKCFTQLSSLNTHMSIHTGEKAHKCSVCEKSFTQTYSLNRHMLIHTGEKPHKCSVCDNSFTQLSCLNEHMFVHTGGKPHKCSVCKKSFIRGSNLNAHMLIHTSKKPH